MLLSQLYWSLFFKIRYRYTSYLGLSREQNFPKPFQLLRRSGLQLLEYYLRLDELAVCDGIGFLEGLAIKPTVLGSLFNQSMIDLTPTLLKK